MKKWSSLEHFLYRHIEAHRDDVDLQGKSLLLAVSGGLDSMVLWKLLETISSSLQLRLGIVSVHHGPTLSPQVLRFRDEAFAMVQEKARAEKTAFWSEKSESLLSSEEQMRDFRKAAVEEIRQRNQFDFSVWAHHENDYLETQIMRLIRGTGEQGIEPMLYFRAPELRPLLLFSRAVLADYAKQHKILFVDDPSNLDQSYLRNWLRQGWLPQLEEKCPGALKSFSRSLKLISEEKSFLPENIFLDQSLSRSIYLTLTGAQKQQAIAQYLRRRGAEEFSHNHIREIMKRLDIPQNEHSFRVAQMLWKVSRDWIFAEATFLVNPR